MKKTGKRLLAAITLSAVLCGAFVGCSGGSSTESSGSNADKVNKEGFPIVDEQITLNFTTMQTPIQSDFNEIVILKNYAEKSNIKVNFTCVPQEFVQERRNIIMASGEGLPDAIMKMNFTASEVSKYGSQGLFIPLNSLIDAGYAPNFKAVLDEYDDYRLGLTMPNGNIYTTGYLLSAPAITNGINMFFNTEALDQIGKKLPTTLNELADVLRAFKDLDYNGNGKNDEVPLTITDHKIQLDRMFLSSFGLLNRGGSHRFVDVDPATNKVRLMQASDNYRDMLMYLNMLYAEGLLDQEAFTMDMPKMIAKGEEGRALSYLFVNHSIIGNAYGVKSAGLTQPLKADGYDDPKWGAPGARLSGAGNFVITKDNKYPEATMRWIDYFYSDEGVREYFMGVEGETYEVDADGNYNYTDFVMNNPDGIMFEQVLGSYVPWAGGSNPSIAGDKYFKGGEMQPITKAAADALAPYRIEKVWPNFLWDEADADDMNAIFTDIETYVNENRALFVTGKRSFDEWDAYVKGFENMRADKYLEVYAKTMERYGG